MLHGSFMSRREHDRVPGRQDGSGDAAHLHADDLAADGAAQAGIGRMTEEPPLNIEVIDRPAAEAAQRDTVNVLRALAMDAVQKANSGHPGMPMGMAEIAEVLWRRHLRHNPANPDWVDRDRFVLSNGHGSMLLYALLHLTGYDLSIDELKRFRQLAFEDPGPSGIRRDAGRRDDHRPARPGHRQCCRHGDRGEAARGRVQPAGLRHRRSPHLRVPRRWLPDGRHLARSLLARRHAGPRQADRLL